MARTDTTDLANGTRPRRILLVDDDAGFRALSAATLLSEGFEVMEAGDGREGVARAESDRPDLVLCDISMPLLDGFGVAAALRGNEQTRDLPLVFLTAETDPGIEARADAAGALGVLTKPLLPGAVPVYVQALIDGAALPTLDAEAGPLRPDAELLPLIARGDLDALGAIYERHIEVTWRVALACAASSETAEQAVAHAFLQVWRKPDPNDSAGLATRLLASVSREAHRSRRLLSEKGQRMTTRSDRPPRSIMAAVNEQIERLHSSFELPDSAFFCECGHAACKERITLTRSEYARMLDESRPIVAARHVTPEVELRELRARVEHMRKAVGSRSTIEQAKGLLAGRGDMTLDEAFELLRARARAQHRGLEEICAELVADPATLEAEGASERPIRLGGEQGRRKRHGL